MYLDEYLFLAVQHGKQTMYYWSFDHNIYAHFVRQEVKKYSMNRSLRGFYYKIIKPHSHSLRGGSVES